MPPPTPITDSKVLRFDINIPQQVALKYPGGKPVEGRYGDQLFFTLDDGHTMYVPPIVGSRIGELQIRPGEPFVICKKEVKNGQKRSINWIVDRIDATRTPVQAAHTPVQPGAESQLERDLKASVERAHQPKSNGASPPIPPNDFTDIAAGAAPNGNGHGSNGNGRTKVNGQGQTSADIARACYRDAIDVALESVTYAKSKGLMLAPSFEDIRCLSATLLINH